jgi:hypothetical protein
MIRTFKAQTDIAIDSSVVWNTIKHRKFVKDFLPEIYKDILGMSLAKLALHKNGLDVMPSYVVPDKTIHWHNSGQTVIELTRSDLPVMIDHVEINMKAVGDTTAVDIVVEYNSPIGANFMLINKIIKTLFSHKLAVLKQDLEMYKQDDTNLQAAFG